MLSRPKVVAVALLLVTWGSVLAGGDDLQLVQPNGSGLKLAVLKTHEGSDARFTGHAWVTGRFVAWWPAGSRELLDKTPEYLLVPDAKSTDKLPHFTLLYEHKLVRYPVKTVSLTNGEDVLVSIVGEGRARQLLDRHVDSVDATGRFLVEEYEVGVECDAAWAHAKIVRAVLPHELFAGKADVPEGC
jgi:hypothetical protein